MPKRLKEKELDQILRPLPMKERKRVKAAELSKHWLDKEIEKAKYAKKQDISFGLPWFVAYGFCLWKFQYTTPTLILFFIGLAYFCYAIFTRGTYGLNSRRVQVFEELKKHI